MDQCTAAPFCLYCKKEHVFSNYPVFKEDLKKAKNSKQKTYAEALSLKPSVTTAKYSLSKESLTDTISSSRNLDTLKESASAATLKKNASPTTVLLDSKQDPTKEKVLKSILKKKAKKRFVIHMKNYKPTFLNSFQIINF
jgi:hypothetical protein